MGVDEGSKVAFGVFAGARQLFCYVGFAVGGWATEERGVGCYVSDVNAVGTSIAALEDASTYTIGIVVGVRDVGEATTAGIYL